MDQVAGYIVLAVVVILCVFAFVTDRNDVTVWRHFRITRANRAIGRIAADVRRERDRQSRALPVQGPRRLEALRESTTVSQMSAVRPRDRGMGYGSARAVDYRRRLTETAHDVDTLRDPLK